MNKPPRGWEISKHNPNSNYFTKKTQFGLHFMCRHCLRKPMAAGRKDHKKSCVMMMPDEPFLIKQALQKFQERSETDQVSFDDASETLAFVAFRRPTSFGLTTELRMSVFGDGTFLMYEDFSYCSSDEPRPNYIARAEVHGRALQLIKDLGLKERS